ncbi:MAG: esterase-like activity of phytase family protein [Bryobacterales bacterium]|nr:esterase-like activity of phytase family protein [Bryobacterales bacterium]
MHDNNFCLRTWRRKFSGLVLGASLTSALCAQGTITEIHTLPEQGLGSFQNTYLPGTVLYDHGFKLGGVGSDLWKGPGDGPGVFWMITDRGPNPQTAAPVRRSFPVAAWTPFILKVKAENGVISILQAIPLTGNGGGAVTGLPNEPLATSPANPNALGDEQPYNCDITAVIPGNHDGLDPEGLVRDVHGNFWVADEYGPSLSKISAAGLVLKRFVPVGRAAVSGDHYTVVGNLPQILGRRPRNRGFEGLAITPNNKTLMAVVQSPLVNPNTATGNASRVVRIIAFDADTETPVAEYAYVMQGVNEFNNTNPTEMKISGIAALDQHRFLVLERTDAVAKIYKVDVRQATNILGTKWDLSATSPTLESLATFAAPATTTDTLAANGVTALAKELVIDLSTLGPAIPPKIEGLTVLDGKTIAVSNDNDFQVGPPTCGPNVPPTNPAAQSSIFVIKLDKPIK